MNDIPPDLSLHFDLKNPPIPLEPKVTPEKGDTGNFVLTEGERRELAMLPLKGKIIPPKDSKKAIVLWGPPGSGKTKKGQELFVKDSDTNSFVTICYDENGAMQSIKDHLKRDGTSAPYEERLALYRQYRDDSQRIRSYTLNEAMARGHDLFIDITASGKGTVKMIEKLQSEGYQVEVVGYLASAEVAEERINQRGSKIVEPGEEISKRIGCYESLPVLMRQADKFSLYLNNKGKNPKKIIETNRDGQSVFTSSRSRYVLEGILSRDEKYFANHTEESIKNKTGELQAAITELQSNLPPITKTWKKRITERAQRVIGR